MAIIHGLTKMKNYVQTALGHKLVSLWTSSETVEMNNGNTLEDEIKNYLPANEIINYIPKNNGTATNLTIGNTLNVNGNSSLDGNVDILGNVELGGNLSLDGSNINLDNGNIVMTDSNISVNGSISVDSDSTIQRLIDNQEYDYVCDYYGGIGEAPSYLSVEQALDGRQVNSDGTTNTKLLSITLSPGVYLVQCVAIWQSSSTKGFRHLEICEQNTTADRFSSVTSSAGPSYDRQNFTKIFHITTTTTLDLNAGQNSGNPITVLSGVKTLRIGNS